MVVLFFFNCNVIYIFKFYFVVFCFEKIVIIISDVVVIDIKFKGYFLYYNVGKYDNINKYF